MKSRSQLLGAKAALAVAVAALAYGAVPAFAQSSDEDIIVTARKREESLQKVPVAVTAFSGAQLAQQGVRSPVELGRQIPSLTVQVQTKSSDVVTFNIRGQTGSDVLLTIDQAVGLYVDGFNYPRPYGVSAGLVDIARVEVLKGPQGTLYGRNTTGGAVNIITRGADYDGIHGYVFGEGGNYRNIRFNGAVNVPIVEDKLAARLMFQRWSRNGYGESRITGQDLGGDKNQYFFRGSLLANPAEGVTVEVKGEWLRMRENGFLGVPVNYTTGLGGQTQGTNFQAAFELGLDPFVQANRDIAQAFLLNLAAQGRADIFTTDTGSTNLHNDLDSHTLSGTVTFDLADNVQLKSITGYRRIAEDSETDLDATRFRILGVGVDSPGPVFFPDFNLVEDKFFTQEFNLSGQAMDDRLEWLGGVFYSNENGNDATTNNFRFDQTRLTCIASNPPTAACPVSFLPGTGTRFTMNFNQGLDIQNTSWSVYSQNDYHFTDDLTLTFGGRYTEERHGLTAANRRFDPLTGDYLCQTPSVATGTALQSNIVTKDPSVCFFRRDVNFTGFSWMGSLNYQVTDDMLVYLKTARGFRGGGLNLRLPGANAFEPETARDIEVGFKSDFFEHRLRMNLAAYTTKYANKQESIIVTLPGVASPQTLVQNAATAKIKGVEAEVTVIPVEGLTLRATGTYLNGKYVSFPGALNILGQVVNATGEKFANPPWSYSVSGRYEFPIFNGTLAAQADWSWTAGANPPPRLQDPFVPAAIANDLVSGQFGFQIGRASLGLLNGRVEYNMEDYGVSVAFFSTNLLNKKYQYVTLASPSVGGVLEGVTAEPRMWGVQLRKSFGEGE